MPERTEKTPTYRFRMNVFDIIVLVCLLVALCIGIKKGLISQVVSLVALCLGVWLSVKFCPQLSVWLGSWLTLDATVLKVIAFILIFIGTTLALRLVGWILEKVVKVVLLGWLNRLLGAVLSIVECLLVLCLVLMIFDALNGTFSFVGNEYLDSAKFYTPLKAVSYSIFPYLKELFFWN